MDKIDFKVPVGVGELVTLEAQVNHAGHTSMEVGVEVYSEDLNTGERRHANSCLVNFVALDKKGRPMPVPTLVTETPQEKERFAQARERRKQRLGHD